MTDILKQDESVVKMVDHALAYTLRGWRVFPCHIPQDGRCSCGKDGCPNPGKHPRTVHGFHDATCDEAQIRAWWSQWPDANIGVRTGTSCGLVVLDQDGSVGRQSLAGKHLPITQTAITGRGEDHVHRFYAHPGVEVKSRPVLTKVDVKGDGGYVIAPPSLHISGRRYRWADGLSPNDVPMAPCPLWLLDHAQECAPEPGHADRETGPIPQGLRNTRLAQIAGALRRRGCGEAEILTSIRAVNETRCDPPLPDDEVASIAASVARYPTGAPDASELQTTKDYAHAETMAELFRNRLRWTPAWGQWRTWTGKVWKEVPEEWVSTVASEELRAEYGRRIAACGDKPTIAHWTNLATQTCVYARIQGGLAFLKGWPGFLTGTEEWDADPWALNVQNGIFDLRAGELRPHDPEALHTKLAGANFDPQAQCPAWEAHLRRFLPNDNVRRQVQRGLGIALVGTTLEETLTIWFGDGQNGKTTTARALMAALGDYAIRTAPNLLIRSKYERHPAEIADLYGSRWAVSVESGDGKALAEDLVKQLTGGDVLKARYIRQNFFQFRQTFSITLLTNHRPEVSGVDEGIWRRIHLIPWTVAITPADRRPQETVLAELTAESAAILSWAIAGLADWQGERWWIAPEVQEATARYREAQDRLGGFMADCCDRGPNCTVPVGKLYEIYQTWCERNSEAALSKTDFGKNIRKRGINQKLVGKSNVRAWLGIRIRPEGEDLTIAKPSGEFGFMAENGVSADWDRNNGNRRAEASGHSISPNASGNAMAHTESPLAFARQGVEQDDNPRGDTVYGREGVKEPHGNASPASAHGRVDVASCATCSFLAGKSLCAAFTPSRQVRPEDRACLRYRL